MRRGSGTAGFAKRLKLSRAPLALIASVALARSWLPLRHMIHGLNRLDVVSGEELDSSA